MSDKTDSKGSDEKEFRILPHPDVRSLRILLRRRS
jgi:hypothetical protein